VNAGKINFGLVLIIVGVAALAVNLDYMDWSVLLDLLNLWPVLLIALGISLIFRRLPVPQLAYLSSLLILAVGAYVLYTSFELYAGDGDKRTAAVNLSALDDSITHIEYDIDIDGCDLSVGSGTEDLVRCAYSGHFGKPSIKYRSDTDWANVSLKEGKIPGIGFFHVDSYDFDWNVDLYDKLPLSLNLDCHDSDIRLHLGDLPVDTIVCRTPYSTVDLTLGMMTPRVDISMRVHKADLQLRVPDSVGVEITDSPQFSDYYVGDIDFIRDGGVMRTANFDSASVKYEFDFAGDAKILRIVRY